MKTRAELMKDSFRREYMGKLLANVNYTVSVVLSLTFKELNDIEKVD